MGDENQTTPTFKNPLRVLDLWALGVGIVVCGQYFGWNLGLLNGGPVGMLLASLIVCLLFLVWVLTLAELAVAMPRAGGPLDYGHRAGGPWLGFLMAWSMLLECLFGTIATALATAWYVAFLLNPEQPDSTVVVWAGLGTVVLFFLLQAWGVKEQSKALILMTYAALLGLLIYWFVAGSNFAWDRAWPRSDLLTGKGWKSVLDAVPYALWWLIIIEGIALAAEETHQPHRSIPRGLVLAMLTVIVMVVLTLGLTAGAVPWQDVTGDYPLAKVVRDVTEGRPAWLIYGFGTIALFGLIASYHGLLYSTSRQAFALGRSGHLPVWLGGVNEARRTPIPSLLVCSLITAGFVVASVWYKDAILVAILVAGLAALILYILTMACLICLRRREPELFHAYRAPLGWLLPAAVVLLSGFAIFVYAGIEHGETVLILGAAIYALGLGIFAFRRIRGMVAAGASLAGPKPADVSLRSTSPSPWLDRLAGISLVAALLMVAWVVTSAFRPDWLSLGSVETEAVVCVVVFGAALALVSSVAVGAHPAPLGSKPRRGCGMTTPALLGRVSALWRYPVKSMAGEELGTCEVTERGLLGDRAYALVDEATGVIGSAKNPRAWPDLLAFRAVFTDPPQAGAALPAVCITLPDGRVMTSSDSAGEELSAAFGRRVVLSARPPERPVLQQFWPDLEGTGGGEAVTDEAMPPGTFFDLALVNVLVSTTLDRLAAAHPDGQFDVRRFRPNIVIVPEPTGGVDLEAEWAGHTLAIGDRLRLRIDARCTRCVMTTLPQGSQPRDPGILRTVVRANGGFAGLNATVVQPGIVRVGDSVRFADGVRGPDP